MVTESSELPGWLFEIEEVSAGVYRGTGKDINGRKVEGTGIDPDVLLQSLKRAVPKTLNLTPGPRLTPDT